MPNPPVINYRSSRLIGIELEVDAGSTKLRLPDLHEGWEKKADGSLRNGYEFVLNPALPQETAETTVRTFLEALDKARANTTKRGGLHVHVQASDYDEDHIDSFSLAKLYSHFQPVIDTLVGKSRVNNQYCQPYRAGITKDQLISMFNMDSPATDRNSARVSRRYSVVNFAMMRCARPAMRSVEFRQGSPSKRHECVWGWATLMVCLVDMALEPLLMEHEIMREEPTLANFAQLISFHEQRKGFSGVADWVLWRHDYINADPTEDQIARAVSLMGHAPRGLFHISRSMDINLPLAAKIMDQAERLGLVTAMRAAGGKKYRAQYSNWAEQDLAQLEEAARVRAITRPPGSESEWDELAEGPELMQR